MEMPKLGNGEVLFFIVFGEHDEGFAINSRVCLESYFIYGSFEMNGESIVGPPR